MTMVTKIKMLAMMMPSGLSITLSTVVYPNTPATSQQYTLRVTRRSRHNESAAAMAADSISTSTPVA